MPQQNLKSLGLAALSALDAVAGFCSKTENTENRLLGLAILQTGLKRIDKESMVRIVP
jgi:hypothetical protein